MLSFSEGENKKMELLEITQKLVGTWRLISSEICEINSQISEPYFGNDATGYLLYNKDGYMSVAFLFPDLPQSGLAAEVWDKETSMFYCGRYTVHSGKLMHHVEINSHPSCSGEQERLFEFIENRLLLSAKFDGKEMRALWERV